MQDNSCKKAEGILPRDGAFCFLLPVTSVLMLIKRFFSVIYRKLFTQLIKES